MSKYTLWSFIERELPSQEEVLEKIVKQESIRKEKAAEEQRNWYVNGGYQKWLKEMDYWNKRSRILGHILNDIEIY